MKDRALPLDLEIVLLHVINGHVHKASEKESQWKSDADIAHGAANRSVSGLGLLQILAMWIKLSYNRDAVALFHLGV